MGGGGRKIDREIEAILDNGESESHLGYMRSCLVGNGKGTKTGSSPDVLQSLSVKCIATGKSVQCGARSPRRLDYIYFFEIGIE